MIAFRLLEPDTARARPSSLLNNSAGWKKVFDENESEELFLKAISVAEAVDSYLASPEAKKIADDATNARHYLVAGYALRASAVKKLADFYKVPSVKLKADPDASTFKELHELLYAKVGDLDDGQVARDKIFKGKNLKVDFFGEILAMN